MHVALQRQCAHLCGRTAFYLGNKCERGAGLPKPKETADIYTYKYEKLLAMPSDEAEGVRGTVGLSLQLVMFEQLPLWTTFFERAASRWSSRTKARANCTF